MALPDIRDWEEFGYIPQERENRRRDQLERQIRDIFKLFERDNNDMCDVREFPTMVRALGLNPLEEQLDAMINEIQEPQSTGLIKLKRDPVTKTLNREQFDQLKLDIRDAIHIVSVPDHPTRSGGPGVIKTGVQKGMRLCKINGKPVRPSGKDGRDELLRRLADAEKASKVEPGQEVLELELDCRLFDADNAEPRRFFELMMETLLTHTFQGVLMVRDSEDKIQRAFETLDPEKRGYIDSEYLRELMTTRGEKFTNEEILEMLNAAADPETGYIKYDDYAPILATD